MRDSSLVGFPLGFELCMMMALVEIVGPADRTALQQRDATSNQ